jgi:RHS repeat-associated protein
MRKNPVCRLARRLASPGFSPVFRFPLSAALLLSLGVLLCRSASAAVTVTANNDYSQVTISWPAQSGSPQNYYLYRSVDGGPFGQIATVSGTSTTDNPGIISGIHVGATLAYKVNFQGTTDLGSASITLNMGAPSVTATGGKAKVSLTWGAVTHASKYKIYWKSTDAATYPGTTLSYWDQTSATSYDQNSTSGFGPYNQKQYYYIVSSVCAVGEVNSAQIGLVGPQIGTPTLTGKLTKSGFTLSWSSVPEADNYTIYYSTSGPPGANAPVYAANVTTTSRTLTTSDLNFLNSNKTVYFAVAGYNNALYGPLSNPVNTADGASPGTSGAAAPEYGCGTCAKAGPAANNSNEGGGGDTPPPDGGDDAGEGNGDGPCLPDPVFVAAGVEENDPAPDIRAYNPIGPPAVWRRMFRGTHAGRGYGSPGMAQGWVHGFDYVIESANPTAWGALKLSYHNGAQETLTPQLDGSGNPTGAFTMPSGAPYFVTGVPSGTVGQWSSFTLTWKSRTQWVFMPWRDRTYVLSSIADRMGHAITLNWDSLRCLTTVTNSAGTALLTFGYDANGLISTVTDCYGRMVAYGNGAVTSGSVSGICLNTVSQVVTSGTVSPPARWTYGYTAVNGALQLGTTTVPSPTGTGTSTATLNYDPTSFKVSSILDASSNQTVFTYNAGSALIQYKDPSGTLTQSYTQNFSATGRNTGITDANGHTYGIGFTDSNNPYRATSWMDATSKSASATYDGFGNVLTSTDARSTLTTYGYDNSVFPLGRLTSVQTGSKPATTFTYYEPSGLVHTVTAPAPSGSGVTTVTTTFTYDSLGNIQTVTGPGNNATSTITTTYNYTTDGGVTIQAAAIGQPVTITDNLGHVRHFRYDAQGRVTSAWDALGNTTGYSYTITGQVQVVTFPATGSTGNGPGSAQYTYLYPGGPLTKVDLYNDASPTPALFRTTTYSRGPEGELLSVGGSGAPESYSLTYDAAYRKKTLSDAKSNTTTWFYTPAGYLDHIVYPDTTQMQYTAYDDAGRLLSMTDGRGVVTNYLYSDPAGALTDIQYPAASARNSHYSYDTYGRLLSKTDGEGAYSFTYGDLDELISSTTTYTGVPGATLSYAYWPDGSRKSLTTPAGSFSYAYDGAGRMNALTDPLSRTASWQYLDNNWLSKQTWGNGAQALYSYNALGRLTELINQKSDGTLLARFGNLSGSQPMTYDPAGNRLSAVVNYAVYPTYSGTTSYTYNPVQSASRDKLTGEASTRNGGYTFGFAYDNAGNPTTFKSATRAYNANNQITGTGFSYDNAGNPTTYSGIGITWGPEGEPTLFGTSLMSAGYRSDGLRAWKTLSTSTGSKNYFVYDGTLPVLELSADGGVRYYNTFGPNGLLSRWIRNSGGSTSVTRFLLWDERGNLANRLDEGQSGGIYTIVDAQGIVTQNLATPESWQFGGQFGYYTDPETGLVLCTYRYYDPGTGRWISRDPAGYGGGVNLYGYVTGNPVNRVDPFGLDPGAGDRSGQVINQSNGDLFISFDIHTSSASSGSAVVVMPLPPGYQTNPDKVDVDYVRINGTWKHLLPHNPKVPFCDGHIPFGPYTVTSDLFGADWIWPIVFNVFTPSSSSDGNFPFSPPVNMGINMAPASPRDPRPVRPYLFLLQNDPRVNGFISKL